MCLRRAQVCSLGLATRERARGYLRASVCRLASCFDANAFDANPQVTTSSAAVCVRQKSHTHTRTKTHTNRVCVCARTQLVRMHILRVDTDIHNGRALCAQSTSWRPMLTALCASAIWRQNLLLSPLARNARSRPGIKSLARGPHAMRACSGTREHSKQATHTHKESAASESDACTRRVQCAPTHHHTAVKKATATTILASALCLCAVMFFKWPHKAHCVPHQCRPKNASPAQTQRV